MVISAFGILVLLNSRAEDISQLSPCTHEDANTRLLLHAVDAAASGYQRLMVRTVDTDVIVLFIALFAQLSLTEMWVLFGSYQLIPYLRPWAHNYVSANVQCLYWV